MQVNRLTTLISWWGASGVTHSTQDGFPLRKWSEELRGACSPVLWRMQFPPILRFRRFLAPLATGLLMVPAQAREAAPGNGETVKSALGSLGLDDDARQEILTRIETWRKDGNTLPAKAVTALNEADGRDEVRDFLRGNGFADSDLDWLGKLPDDGPPDARAVAIVFRAGQLLEQGPPRFRSQWPEWDKGDTPGKDAAAKLPDGKDADIASLLQPFVPRNPVYGILHTAYTDLRENLAQRKKDFISIPPIHEDEIVEPGQAYAGAEILAKRLVEGGYLEKIPDLSSPEDKENAGDKETAPETHPTIFTKELSDAVKRYQKDFGRADDGILGPNTLAELNRGPEEQLEILRINLHRARILPDEMGAKYVLVNIPSARVVGFSGGDKPKVDMRTIVGKAVKERQTPIFRDVMHTVKFGPYWNVPRSIAEKEIVPKAREDSGYIERERFEIVSDFGADDTLPATSANLSQVAAGELFIRQKPGPENALGSVKFLFRNDHAIYLHDTPADQLFSETERDFSHGCIRLEDPARFAGFVLGAQGWDAARIKDALGNPETVEVEEPVNVYIVYFTAFPTWDPKGRAVSFEPDIYGKDGDLQASGSGG